MLSFPHATSPRMLARLCEQIAAGHRRPRALGEVLGVEAPVLRSYLLAAEWLGLVDLADEPTLSRAGLEYVYAGPRRAAVLAARVATHPVLGPLLPPAGGAAPTPAERPLARRVGPRVRTDAAIDLPALEALVRRDNPSLGARAARARALGLRRLLGPALRPPPRVAVPPPPDPTELALPLPARPPEQLALGFASEVATAAPALDLRAGADDSPDVYTHLLRALLDHGELDPHQVRGLLDAAGGRDCGLGGYLAMATRRGDATRVGDVLVVTAGAAARRDLAESPVSVALSDPDFRAHLAALAAGRPGDARRFRPWTNRLFSAGTLDENLDRLLFGRRLSSFPVAGDPGEPVVAHGDPFLASIDRRGIAIATPSSLSLVAGGLATINQLLRAQRAGTVARPPHALDRRARVHGGLLHPGEAALRVVPDVVSLRHRALRNVPAFAILVALGLLDRRGVVKLRVYGQELLVQSADRRPRRVDTLVDALCQARGWTLARSPTGLSWVALAELAEQLGLLTTVAPWLTVDEALFRKLGSDPEHRDLLEGLDPLAELLASRVGRR